MWCAVIALACFALGFILGAAGAKLTWYRTDLAQKVGEMEARMKTIERDFAVHAAGCGNRRAFH